MKTIDKIITPINTKFGAPMGRANIDTCKKETVNGQLMSYTGKLFDCAIRLDNGGYDKGGAYWGLGSQLRVTYNKDLTYIQFYRK